MVFGTKESWGNRTEEGTGQEKSGNGAGEGEQREIPVLKEEAEGLSIEDQVQADAIRQTRSQG